MIDSHALACVRRLVRTRLLVVWLAFCPLLMAQVTPHLEYGSPSELCKLQNKRINESSGLAVSRIVPNRFWTHNDSGDRARLYCFDSRGKHLGTSKIKDASAVDWEDICSFEFNGYKKLLIGDIGDNGKRRNSCRLYLLDEPRNPTDEVKKLQEIKLRYSTGPMDCEALAIDVENQKLLLVEKVASLRLFRKTASRVFIADFPLDPATGNLKSTSKSGKRPEIVAKQIGKVDLALVCAMDISKDNRHAVVLTLGQAFEVVRHADEGWEAAFARKPRKVDVPPRRQGESICYGSLGRDLFLTSEMTPTPLFKVPAKP